jgi:hypothetical protein
MLARMVVMSIVVGACHASSSPPQFGITSVTAVNSSTLDVVFNDVPDPTAAETATNYTIPGLTVKTASSAGDGTVTLVTEPQTNASYTLTVANITRASDAQPLAAATTTFAGKSTFNVVSAAAVDGYTFTVTFDAAPDPTQATDKRNYGISWGSENIYYLSSVMLTLDGSTVTFSNAPQVGREPYYVFVGTNVTRASDGERLRRAMADFRGISAQFFVLDANSRGVFAVTVLFVDVAEPISATTLANYTIPGLTLSGTPTLSSTLAGSAVTLTTSAQKDTIYTVTVANVTRASNGEGLCTSCRPDKTFFGTSHCNDSILDGDETDIDCGGSSCPKCASGKTCLVSTDCVGGTCTGGPPGTCM